MDALETKILELLECRGTGKTICPSEVARAMANSDRRSDWEPFMEPIRAAPRRLAADGRIVITQGDEWSILLAQEVRSD